MLHNIFQLSVRFKMLFLRRSLHSQFRLIMVPLHTLFTKGTFSFKVIGAVSNLLVFSFMVEVTFITPSTSSPKMMPAVDFLIPRFFGLQHTAHPAFILG
ncbi:unnamed protein product [Heterosigma akashiwo]